MPTPVRLYFGLFIILFLHYAASAQVVAGFTINAPALNCNPAVYSFTNTSTGTGLSYQWNFGVYTGVNSVFRDPGTTYLTCGTFQVKLVVTDTTGRKDSSIQTVNIRCSPKADFTTQAAVGCVPFTTTFNSTSTPGSGSITNYIWDFGDGNGGAGNNPGHTYHVAGCKNVTLIVTNSFNCTSDTTINSEVCIYQPPVAAFSSSGQTSCSAPYSVTYQANASGGTSPYSYQWIFQGGVPAASTMVSPSVVYNTPGSFSTTLIITDAHGCADTLVKSNYISVANNSVSFTNGTIPTCAPATVAVNGTATPSPVSWHWSINSPGTIAAASNQNTTVSLPDSGNYNICLSATFAGGCVAQKCSTVYVHNPPVAKFGITGALNTCVVPDVITFQDSSTGNNLSYHWSFPGGSPSVDNTSGPPPVTYGICGRYSAALTVTDGLGCRGFLSRSSYLNITCNQASYTVVPGNGCLPLTASFNSTASTGNPTAWLWDFDDPSSGAANTSTLQNPTHTYFNDGCYTVKLTTTNAQGCTSQYELPAGVCGGFKPHANFSANPPVNCANLPFQFNDSSTGTYSYTTYAWDFRNTPPFITLGNTPNPSYTYFDVGIYNITLIVSNYGCADTITKDDCVRTLVPFSSPRYIRNCSNSLSVTLDGTHSEGASHYSWIILGGTPASDTMPTLVATFPSAGDYNVSLYVVNDTTGCSDLQNIVVHVGGLTTQFSASPLIGCQPLRSCFSNTSVNASNYQWRVTNSFGVVDTTDTIGSPCFNFPVAGKYSVQLIVTDTFGCIDTLYKPDYITVTHPVPDFSGLPTVGCAPLSVDFFDSTRSNFSGVAQWKWDFGDSISGTADSSLLQNPSHHYARAGTYSVGLSVTDSNGCRTDSIKRNYILADRPSATFTSISVSNCQGTQTCFTADSLNILFMYHWDYGDGGTDDSQSVCHIFDTTGLFPVSLVVTDSLGCRDTVMNADTARVVVPHPDFVADTTVSTCPPLAVSFTNLSTGIDNLITFHWDFGDGQVSSLADPFHIYSVAGRFTVSLVAINTNGCSDTITYPDYININGPSAYISLPPTSGCVPHNTCMAAISGSTNNYIWNLGDGNVITGGTDSICYTYSRTGIFYPELILNDGANCIFSLPMGRVDVGGSVAKFLTDTTVFCGQGTVSFTDSSYGTSAVQSRNWNFGDTVSGAQNISSQQDPQHYFTAPGAYHVTELIATADGCLDSTSGMVTVHPLPAPLIVFNDTTPCAPDNVMFAGHTNSSDSVVNRLWDFGDALSGSNDSSVLQNPAHNYAAAGTYQVNFAETNIFGCTANNTAFVTVHPNPRALYIAHDTCLNTQPIVFTNNSTDATNYAWNFGDGSNSLLINVSHTYRDRGSFIVQLVAHNNYCSDTFSQAVNIFPVPIAAFSVNNNTVCGAPAEFILNNNSTGATHYLWDFGNDSTSVIQDPVPHYSATGQYTILLTAINDHSCKDTASGRVTVYPVPNIQSVDVLPANGCKPVSVSFDATVSDGNTYTWDFGTGTGTVNANTPSASYTYNDTGAYTVSLHVTSVNGCVDSVVLPDTVRVHIVPVADFDTVVDLTVYPNNGTAAFLNLSQNADNYLWDFGDGTTSTDTNPSHSYGRTDQYTVYLIAMTQYGCTDTANKTIYVFKKALYVPNALQPDNAGADELVRVWKPVGIGLQSYKAQVFDQWGTLMWQSDSLSETQPVEAWDGTYKGKPCPQDVYVWKIEATFIDGTRWEGMTYAKDEGGGKRG